MICKVLMLEWRGTLGNWTGNIWAGLDCVNIKWLNVNAVMVILNVSWLLPV